MKQWTKKSGLTGPKLKTVMDDVEVRILFTLVEHVDTALRGRSESVPRDELAELTGMPFGHTKAPEDAMLARLLPDFQRTDVVIDTAQQSPSIPDDLSGLQDTPAASIQRDPGEIAADNSAMRALHEQGIIDAKRNHLAIVKSCLPKGGGAIALTPEQAQSWLMGLTDLRISMAFTIGSGQEGSADIPEEIDPDDPHAGYYEIYHWLTVVQDTLCTALFGEV